MPREYVTGESIDSVTKNLLEVVFPKVTDLEFQDPTSVIGWLTEFDAIFPELNGQLCVNAAFELALLDAAGKTFNMPVVEMLGGAKTERVQYSGIVSAENPMVVEQFIKQFKNVGINTVKLKVGTNPEQDLANIKVARHLLGPDASIRVDANEAWHLEQAQQQLEQLIPFGVESVEQPLPTNQKQDYPALMSYLGDRMRISLDESLCSYEDGLWMCEHNDGSVFNLRVSKNGGIIKSLKLHALAERHGIKCQLGAQVGETSLLTSAGLILALLTGDCLYHEGAFGTLLLEQDIVDEPLQFGREGWLDLERIRSQAGLGVKVNPATLEALTTQFYS